MQRVVQGPCPWSTVRNAIRSPQDGIGNGVSSHKYRRDKYRPGRSADGWSTRNSAELCPRLNRFWERSPASRRRLLLCLLSATRAASLPPSGPLPSRASCERQLYHLVFALRFAPLANAKLAAILYWLRAMVGIGGSMQWTPVTKWNCMGKSSRRFIIYYYNNRKLPLIILITPEEYFCNDLYFDLLNRYIFICVSRRINLTINTQYKL